MTFATNVDVPQMMNSNDLGVMFPLNLLQHHQGSLIICLLLSLKPRWLMMNLPEVEELHLLRSLLKLKVKAKPQYYKNTPSPASFI